MSDHVVDTNVLLVASVPDPMSPFKDTHVPLKEQRRVFEWLVAFRGDGGRVAVLDAQFKIWSEYKDNLSEQDFGSLVMREKLQTARFHSVTYDDNGHALLPAPLEAAVPDHEDRKFVAVALADAGRSTIVNATDGDWLKAETALAAKGIQIEQLLDAWLRGSSR